MVLALLSSTPSTTPPPITAAPHLYCAFYANPATDPYHGNYQEALVYFGLITRVNPTPQVVANQVYTAAT